METPHKKLLVSNTLANCQQVYSLFFPFAIWRALNIFLFKRWNIIICLRFSWFGGSSAFKPYSVLLRPWTFLNISHHYFSILAPNSEFFSLLRKSHIGIALEIWWDGQGNAKGKNSLSIHHYFISDSTIAPSAKRAFCNYRCNSMLKNSTVCPKDFSQYQEMG